MLIHSEWNVPHNRKPIDTIWICKTGIVYCLKYIGPILSFSTKGILLKVIRNPCTTSTCSHTHTELWFLRQSCLEEHTFLTSISITIWKWTNWWVWSLYMHTYYYSVLTWFFILMNFSSWNKMINRKWENWRLCCSAHSKKHIVKSPSNIYLNTAKMA